MEEAKKVALSSADMRRVKYVSERIAPDARNSVQLAVDRFLAFKNRS
jgi:hypothetical protein